MRKESLGTIVGLLAAVVVAVGTVFLSYYRLKVPQIPLDWVALIFSGLTMGCLAFFIVWGHFQKDPEPARFCPNCGETLENVTGLLDVAMKINAPIWEKIGDRLKCPKCGWDSDKRNTGISVK